MRKEEITREQYLAMARLHAAHRVNKELDEQDCPYNNIENPDEALLEECGAVCTNPWGCHTFRHLRGDRSVEKEQSRYDVYGTVVGSKYLGQVEAKDEEEAKEKGLELDTVFISLCNQCAREVEDAEVQEITVEKC